MDLVYGIAYSGHTLYSTPYVKSAVVRKVCFFRSSAFGAEPT